MKKILIIIFFYSSKSISFFYERDFTICPDSCLIKVLKFGKYLAISFLELGLISFFKDEKINKDNGWNQPNQSSYRYTNNKSSHWLRLEKTTILFSRVNWWCHYGIITWGKFRLTIFIVITLGFLNSHATMLSSNRL